jgi:multiple sugar transport system permease protein
MSGNSNSNSNQASLSNSRTAPTVRVHRGSWLGKILVTVLVIFIALPILWLAYAAFLPKEVVFSGAAVPVGFTLNNFLELPFAELIRPLILSMVLSTLVAFLQLIFALPAAFAIRAGTKILWFFLLMLPISADLLIIPLYGLLKDLNLLNSPLALVLPFLVSPFTVFLLYSGLVRLPWAYVEAAKLDGASNFQIITRVIAPLLRPELTAAGVLAFAAHWNIVLFPKVMLNDKNWYTVQVALSEMLRRDPNNWGQLGAAAMLTSLPILVLYLIFESRVTKTIEGGIK